MALVACTDDYYSLLNVTMDIECAVCGVLRNGSEFCQVRPLPTSMLMGRTLLWLW